MYHKRITREYSMSTMTKTLSISEARGRLGRFVDRVEKRSATYAITKKGLTRAVLISSAEYESWNATLEILSSEKDMAAIEKGIADLNAGKGRSFEEVFGEPLNDPDHQIRPIITRRR